MWAWLLAENASLTVCCSCTFFFCASNSTGPNDLANKKNLDLILDLDLSLNLDQSYSYGLYYLIPHSSFPFTLKETYVFATEICAPWIAFSESAVVGPRLGCPNLPVRGVVSLK
jgi:hypothetical protein